MKHSEMVLPIEVVLRDLAAYAKHPSTGEPYCLWIDGINSALKERDDENEKLREALEMMVNMVEMNGFGKAAALDIARTALENKHER